MHATCEPLEPSWATVRCPIQCEGNSGGPGFQLGVGHFLPGQALLGPSHGLLSLAAGQPVHFCHVQLSREESRAPGTPTAGRLHRGLH